MLKKKKEIRLADVLAAPVSHYCDAVQYGDTLYISGKAARDTEGNVVFPGDVKKQTRRVLESIKLILDHCGATFDNIVKVTVLLTNIADREAVNEVRKEFFGDSYPASTLFEVSRLVHEDMLVEIEAIAHLD